MNMPNPSSPSTSAPRNSASESSPPATRGENLRQHRARDDFERALQSRARRDDSPDSGDDRDDDDIQLQAPAWAVGLPAAPALRAAAAAANTAGAGVITEPSGTRAAIEASLSSCPGEAVAPLTGAAPPALWEVSLGGSQAVPLAVRAERIGTDAQRGWGLTIASSGPNVEMLARHAPRLNERLRKHAIDVDHVRIEQADDGQQE